MFFNHRDFGKGWWFNDAFPLMPKSKVPYFEPIERERAKKIATNEKHLGDVLKVLLNESWIMWRPIRLQPRNCFCTPHHTYWRTASNLWFKVRLQKCHEMWMWSKKNCYNEAIKANDYKNVIHVYCLGLSFTKKKRCAVKIKSKLFPPIKMFAVCLFSSFVRTI